jgi:DNA-binding transcriptional ArsR family regulator
MSPATRNAPASARRRCVPVFAALGDETRLSLIGKLSGGPPLSIARLSAGSKLSRQAITKHLRILEDAGLVRSLRSGRESLCEFNAEPIKEIREYLDSVSAQWDVALSRLKAMVEGSRP